jgi:BirA family biotin operon repressor/biotin-[acetyl-CoA-carboxylase] ligase
VYKEGPLAHHLGYRVQHLPTVGSTNAEAFAAVENGAGPRLWIVADQQTSGRGRRGRVWETLQGNLAASLVAPEILTPGRIGLLGFMLAVAVAETIESFSGRAHVTLKWPNDIFLNNAKLCGILIESRQGKDDIPVVVCGIGVNCAQAPVNAGYPAISLNDAGIKVPAAAFFEKLSDMIAAHFDRWNDGLGFPALRESWLSRARDLGQTITLRRGHASITGIFRDLSLTGALVLRDEHGEEHFFTSGDIFNKENNG